MITHKANMFFSNLLSIYRDLLTELENRGYFPAQVTKYFLEQLETLFQII